jgi:cation transport ATPase
MEFEQMKKIWDAQDGQALYTIDEKALHNNVIAKKKKSAQTANNMELTLIGSLLVASGMIWWAMLRNSSFQLVQVVFASLLLLVAAAILISRRKRMAWQNSFENSMLGDLEQGLANASYQVNLSKAAGFLYLLVSGFAVVSVFNEVADWWKSALVLLLFAFGYFASRWEHSKFYVSQKKNLTAMKEQLMRMENGDPENRSE